MNFVYRLALIMLVACPNLIYAQDLKPIKLLEPRIKGGMPLMQALKDRRSIREFSTQELPLRVISDLLWAAFGINRPETGGRTAPSASNMQEIDIYVARADGLYLFNAKANMLMPVVAGDIRGLTGGQSFVKDAPLNFVYVADLSKMSNVPAGGVRFLSACDTGFISQNVYLYCAQEGLATVVRGWIDRPTLAKAMKLRPDQRIILAQTVGYPKR